MGVGRAAKGSRSGRGVACSVFALGIREAASSSGSEVDFRADGAATALTVLPRASGTIGTGLAFAAVHVTGNSVRVRVQGSGYVRDEDIKSSVGGCTIADTVTASASGTVHSWPNGAFAVAVAHCTGAGKSHQESTYEYNKEEGLRVSHY